MYRGSTLCDRTMQTKRLTSWLTVALLAALVFAGQRSIAQSVTLAWDPSTSTNIVSYAIYYGTVSRQYTVKTDVGNVTTATLRNLTPGLTYYFAATAIDSTGVESSLSTEVSYRVVTTLPAIQGLTSVTFSRNHSSGQVPFTLSFPLTSSNAVFRAESSNPQLLPTSAVSFGGLGTNRWLSFTSGLDLFGSATLTVVLTDGITIRKQGVCHRFTHHRHFAHGAHVRFAEPRAGIQAQIANHLIFAGNAVQPCSPVAVAADHLTIGAHDGRHGGKQRAFALQLFRIGERKPVE